MACRSAPTAVAAGHKPCLFFAGGAFESDPALATAFRRALETDPAASFGSTVGLNRPVDEATAREVAEGTFEGLVGPGYTEEALRILAARPELEVLQVPPNPADGLRDYGIAALDFKRVGGGLLVETLDGTALDRGQLRVVTQRRPTLEELNDLMFAWKAAAHVRSNAIVLARNLQTVGGFSYTPEELAFATA